MDDTEAAPAPETEVATPDATVVVATPEPDSVEAGMEALRQQLAAAEAARQRAETERDSIAQQHQAEQAARAETERRTQTEVGAMRLSVADAQYDAVVNALAATQGQIVTAKQALAAAMAEGDGTKVADLSVEIGRLAATERDFDGSKTHLDNLRKQPPPQQQPQRNPRDEVLRSLSSRSAAWMRTADGGIPRVDRYLTDPRFQSLVIGADSLARGKGIPVDSDAYFQFIDQQVGIAPPPNDGGQQPIAQPPPTSSAGVTQPRQSPHPAAPPSGSTQSVARTGGGGDIRLTAEQRDFCRTSGIDEVAYAKQLKKMIDAGEITQH